MRYKVQRAWYEAQKVLRTKHKVQSTTFSTRLTKVRSTEYKGNTIEVQSARYNV